MQKKLVFDKAIAKEFLNKADDWLEHRSNNLWSDSKYTAKSAIAEYLANQQGYTCYVHRDGEFYDV